MGIFEKTILYVCAVLITLVAGLLMFQPLHASFNLVKPNIFDCVLQSADENNIEQFMNDEPRMLTCTYKCRDWQNSSQIKMVANLTKLYTKLN